MTSTTFSGSASQRVYLRCTRIGGLRHGSAAAFFYACSIAICNPSRCLPSPVVIGDVPIVDAEAGRRVLRTLGRQSLWNVYLANARLSWDYRTHRTDGVSVQDALKDLLKERIPSLRFEVRSPAGAADGVSSKAVYEVARFKAWKHGMGQLYAYARHVPKLRPILYLFGDESRPKQLGEVRESCGSCGIRVEYMRFTADTFGSKVNKSLLPSVSPPAQVHGCGGDKSNCLASALEEAKGLSVVVRDTSSPGDQHPLS